MQSINMTKEQKCPAVCYEGNTLCCYKLFKWFNRWQQENLHNRCDTYQPPSLRGSNKFHTTGKYQHPLVKGDKKFYTMDADVA